MDDNEELFNDDELSDDPFAEDIEWVRQQEEEEYEASASLRVSTLLSELGYDHVDGFFLRFDQIEPANLRGQRFDTLEEAVIWLHEIGVLGFSRVIEMEDDTYAIEIDDDTQ